jgi:hypothetical protein
MNPGPASAAVRGSRLLACLAILLSFPAAAAPSHRVRALLVGVSTYPSLPAELQLQDAPANDVQLFSNYLRKRGVAHADITILSDKVPGAAAPRRREILAGLSRLTGQARPGDTVVLMFSGHGSQQPTRQGARVEPDGLDQIFLPQDAGSWDGVPRQVQNAITDDEIGSALEQLRDRGAFVWAIFDTCHAGTLTSALGSGGARFVAPEWLEASAAAPRPAREYAPTLRSTSTDLLRFESKAGAAGYVAFFASQREQITGQVQVRLDRARRSYGRFTWTLVQALEAKPGASYRQIMEMVLMKYRGMGVFETTPGYEGTALDARVLGDTADPVVQWPVHADDGQLHLDAGLLQGVSAGSVLSLVSGPAAPANEILGYVRVQRAAPVDSILLPVEYNGTPVLRLTSGGMNDEGSTLFYARPVDMADLALRVAKPRRDTRCESPDALLVEAVATLRRRPPFLPRIQWAEAGEDADVRLCQRNGKLIFLEGGDGKRHRHEGLAALAATAPWAGGMTSAAFADAIAETLQHIHAVLNLYRIAAGHASTDLLVEASVQLCRGADTSTTPCARAETVSTTTRPVVHPGDRVQITLRNPAWNPVHVTVLHIDANSRIHTLFPDPAVPQEQARIPARSEALCIPVPPNADSAGFERVLVIAVAEQPHGTSHTGLLRLITRAVRDMVSRDSPQVAFDRPVGFTGFGWMVAPDQAPEGSPHAR